MSAATAQTETFDLDTLVAWVAEHQKQAGLPAEIPDSSKPISLGARAAENTEDVSKLPNSIDAKSPQSSSSTATGAMPLNVGIDQTAADEGSPSSKVPAITYGGSSSEFDKMSTQLEAMIANAAELDALMAGAAEPNKTAAAPTPAQSPADAAARKTVMLFKQAGEERADVLRHYLYGFRLTTAQLHKAAADGTLLKLAEESDDAKPEDDGESDDNGPPANPAGGGADAGGPPPAADGPLPGGAGPAGPPDAGPAPGGPAPGGMGDATVNIQEVAHAMMAMGLPPAVVEQVLTSIQQAPPSGMPADKVAKLDNAIKAARAAGKAMLADDYEFEPKPKSKEAATFRQNAKQYFRELLSYANK